MEEAKVDKPIEDTRLLRQMTQMRRKPTMVRYNQLPQSPPPEGNDGFHEKSEKKAFALQDMVEETSQNLTGNARSLAVYIDGPYGAPASNIFRAHHAVLIATGIGRIFN